MLLLSILLSELNQLGFLVFVLSLKISYFLLQIRQKTTHRPSGLQKIHIDIILCRLKNVWHKVLCYELNIHQFKPLIAQYFCKLRLATNNICITLVLGTTFKQRKVHFLVHFDLRMYCCSNSLIRFGSLRTELLRLSQCIQSILKYTVNRILDEHAILHLILTNFRVISYSVLFTGRAFQMIFLNFYLFCT